MNNRKSKVNREIEAMEGINYEEHEAKGRKQ
jgi:hypothetical protein